MKPAHLAIGALSFLAVTGVAYQFHSYSDRSPVTQGALRDALNKQEKPNSLEEINIKNVLRPDSDSAHIIERTPMGRRVGPGGQEPKNVSELVYLKLYIYCGGGYCRDKAAVARYVGSLESDYGLIETDVKDISGEAHAVYGRMPAEEVKKLQRYPFAWLGEVRVWNWKNAVPAPISIEIFYSHVGGGLSLIGWNNPLPGHKEKVVDAALKELSKANFSYEKIGMDENFESTLVLQGRIAPDDLPALKLVVKNIQLPTFNQALPHVSFDIPYKE